MEPTETMQAKTDVDRNVPTSVTEPSARELYIDVNTGRRQIKNSAAYIASLRRWANEQTLDGEVGANLQLAFRHLEDASMRLGKALQALDGGVSVYDRATTVGA